MRPDDDCPTVDLGPRGADAAAPRADDLEAPAAREPGPAAPLRPTVDLGDAIDRHVATRTETLGAPVLGHDPALHASATQRLPRRPGAESRHLRGESRAESRSQHSHLGGFATTTSPIEALRLDELARTRFFLRVVLVTTLAAVVATLTARARDPFAFQVVLAGCATVALGAGWMLWEIRDDATYSTRRIGPGALLVAVGSYGGVYFWGVASPATAMVVFGLYFFSLGADRRMTLYLYLVCAGLHGLLGGLIMAEAIVDRGIISVRDLPAINQLTALVVVQFLYLITFVTARTSQRVTLETVQRLEQAVRGVAQREALLAEARAELDRALKVGGPGRYTDQLVGTYRLGMLLGRGGMGEVYEARIVDEAGAERGEAAVKLLHPGTMDDPNQVARFLREAEICGRLDCPHVVRVLGVGTTGSETPYLAMERLRGHDLASELRRHRRLQPAAVAVLVEHVARGLEAARLAGVVHRDLKPHNVFCAEEGEARRWKILDFGVSKVGGSGTLTRGHVVGTPAYMAPEQARGEDVDHRADVYGLAAIAFRALTGHPAFTGKDVPTTLYDVVYRVPSQPSVLAVLSHDVDRVLAVGLAKRAADRFATAAELAAWLRAAVDDRLDDDQRRRADELIARAPWGTRSGAGSG